MKNEQINTLKPHISLNVTSIIDSVQFYKKFFGIEPLKFIEPTAERAGYAKFDVQNPPLNLALNEGTFAKGGSLSHLGIQVASTDDVLKTRERWAAAGLPTADEMNVDCCYALQDKTWARDPDGNEWEVFTVLENTQPSAEACACGTKVAAAETAAVKCCTPSDASAGAACC